MFRAAHRSSSGALNSTCSLCLYTHVVTGRCQCWVGNGPFSTQPWQRPVTTWVYKPKVASTV